MESFLTSLLSAALLATLMMSCTGQVVISRGNCPVPGTQSSFDSSRYLGTWYEYETFDHWFERNMVCVRAEYGLNTDNSISVLNAGIREAKIFGRTLFRRPASIDGRATTPDPSKPAELQVSFSQFDMGRNSPNYFIVETDYTDYAVVFSCTKLPGLPLNVQFAWILTRSRGVAPADVSGIKSRLTAAGIHVNEFKRIDQSNCVE